MPASHYRKRGTELAVVFTKEQGGNLGRESVGCKKKKQKKSKRDEAILF